MVCYLGHPSMEEKNFGWLLAALLLFLIAAPLSEDLGFVSERVARGFLFSVLFGLGVWSLRGFGRLFYIGLGFAGIGIILSVLAAREPNLDYFLPKFLATLAFLAVAAWCTAQHVVFRNDISANRVVGAVSLYLMLAVLWAVAYAVVEIMMPGSFSGTTHPSEQPWNNDWLYFSFVTMTTLGYGDIAPVTGTARTLAYLQAVFGQFYIAILVAGLVSAYISDRQQS